MSFINPSFFWFLPLVTLPVIIHILNRPRKRIIVFPAVKFLLPATRKIIRKFKLLQLLLLLLRVLFILLLITAFARPVRRTPLARETVDNFILIDTSYSMAFKTGRESALDTAKDLAGELIDKIPGRFAVAEFNSKLNFITYLSDERARAKDAVEQIKLSPYTTDYASIIKELTETSLVKENIDKNIIILSDFNRAGFKDEEKIPDIENASYMLIEVARGNENIWIENIETQEAYINTPLKINGFIRSNNSAETELYMYINGERRGNKKIEAGKEEEFTFKPVFREEGNYRGKIELQTSMEHNRLAPDDIRYFSFKVKPQIRVLLVDGRPGYTLMSSESYFVDRALSAARYRAPASARVITPEELKTIDLDYYDVLYLLNATVDSEITNKINNFSLNGGGVAIFGGDNVSKKDYNNMLRRLMPVEIMSSNPAEGGSTIEISPESNMQNIFSRAEKDNTDIKFFLPLSASAGMQPDIKIGEEPLLFTYLPPDPRQGPAAIFASAASTRWGGFPLTTQFPVFIHKLTNFLAGESEDDIKHYISGEKMQVESDVEAEIQTDWPDKETDPRYFLPQASFPGHYFLNEKLNTVNLSGGAESELENLSRRRIQEKFPSVSLNISYSDNLKADMLNTLTGEEKSGFFLIIAAAFLIGAEFLRQHIKKRKKDEKK